MKLTRKYFQRAGALILIFALLFVSGCSAGSENAAGDRVTGQTENADKELGDYRYAA